MDEKLKSSFCPRLIDYLIIVGARTTPPVNKKTIPVQLPKLLRRYPPSDHTDFPLFPDMVCFCQPEGCLSVDPKRSGSGIKDLNSFIFAIADTVTEPIRYGICVNFYRPVDTQAPNAENTQTQSTTPATQSSDSAFSSDFKSNIAPSDSDHRDSVGQHQEPQCSTSSAAFAESTKLRNHSLTSLCIISHHPFFTKFHDCLFVLKKLIDACIESSSPNRGGSNKDNVWTALAGGDNEEFSSIVLNDVKEIETWILRLLSVPVPVPGSTRVEVEVLSPTVHEPLLFALPDHLRFPLMDFPMHLPFELLGIKICVKVLTLLLLEKKLLFQSSDYNALSLSIMAFVGMLYPLEYMHAVIPLLPPCWRGSEQLLEANNPFIIGVPSKFFMYKTNFQLPNDIWVVDLDSATLIPPTGDYDKTPDLPEPEITALKSYLTQALNSISAAIQPVSTQEQGASQDQLPPQSLSLSPSTSQRNLQPTQAAVSENSNLMDLTDLNPFVCGSDFDLIDLTTRVAMVRFFNSQNILGYVADQSCILHLFPRPVVVLQIARYLESRPEASPFLNDFAPTEAVEFFAEWSLAPTNAAFKAVQAGVMDPLQIGDKPKWFAHGLTPIRFSVWDDGSSLNGALRWLKELENAADDDSSSNSSSAAYSPMNDSIFELFSPDFSPTSRNRPYSVSRTMSSDLDPTLVYYAPNELKYTVDTIKPKCFAETDDDRPASSALTGYSSRSDLSSLNLSLDLEEEFPAEPLELDSTMVEMVDAFSSSVSLKQESNDNFLKKKPTALSSGHTQQKKKDKNKNKKHKTERKNPQSVPYILEYIDQLEASYKISEGQSAQLPSSSQDKNSATETTQKRRPEDLLDQKLDPTRHAEQDGSKASRQALEVSKQAVGESQHTLADIKTGAKGEVSEKDLNKQSHKIGLLLAKQKKKQNSEAVSASSPIKPVTKKSKKIKRRKNRRKPQLPPQPIEQENMSPTSKSGKNPLWESLLEGTPTKNSASSPAQQEETNSFHTNPDNHGFLNIIIDDILSGRGLGWLKMNRFKKLMEVESYRQFVLNSLNKCLDKEIAPDNHIVEKMCVQKDIWANMLKCFQAITTGLEVSFDNCCLDGTGSVFQMMEIAHTYYKIKYNYDASNELFCISTDSSDCSSSQQESGKTSASEPIKEGSADSYEIGESRIHMFRSLLARTKASFLKKRPSLDLESTTSTDSKRKTKPNTSNVYPGFRYKDDHFIHTYSKDSPNNIRLYLFESLLGRGRSKLWDNMEFWEDAFFDAVSQERNKFGLNQRTHEKLKQYKKLNQSEQTRLVKRENRILSAMLHNLTAILVMLNVNKEDIRRITIELLHISRIPQIHAQELNNIISNLNGFKGNAIVLKSPESRLWQCQRFAVHLGESHSAPKCSLEVRNDGLVLHARDGTVLERWWYNLLINVVCLPNTKTMCLWRRNGNETQVHICYSLKWKSIFNCIAQKIKRLPHINESVLSGSFPIQDTTTGEGGLLKVCIDGILLTFVDSKDFIKVEFLWECVVQTHGRFVLQEIDSNTYKFVYRKYTSLMVDQICRSITCLFSYVKTNMEKNKDRNPYHIIPHIKYVKNMLKQHNEQQQQQILEQNTPLTGPPPTTATVTDTETKNLPTQQESVEEHGIKTKPHTKPMNQSTKAKTSTTVEMRNQQQEKPSEPEQILRAKPPVQQHRLTWPPSSCSSIHSGSLPQLPPRLPLNISAGSEEHSSGPASGPPPAIPPRTGVRERSSLTQKPNVSSPKDHHKQ